MLGLIWTVIVGAVVGAIARFVLPGKDPGGLLNGVLIGIGGSLLATYAGRALGLYEAGQGAGFLASIVGAVVLLLIVRVFRKS
ncbi:MAG: GlsB/YeaQ/YmgE family stress response membrane protein [Armatimonadota bacterium]|nr:GlsB/YeaQ/YmgE family stress response membrane protein [Armatimonadota bacterium]